MQQLEHEPASPDWSSENHRGVALAAEGAWLEAAHAFDRAAASLERATGTDLAAHDALALVLGNLAQSLFHAGHAGEAIPHAQRACALRAAIAGDDAIAVARLRSDLAVMLAASGRLAEAPALLERARIAIEQSAGDEDPRLAIVLENIARVALAAGDVASAEPTLLRLHALLDANDMSTQRADALLDHVAATRRARMATPHAAPPIPPVLFASAAAFTPPALTPVSSTPIANTPIANTPIANTPIANTPIASTPIAGVAVPSIADEPVIDEEMEDQPLLDAVRVTDTLLRTTPTGVPVIRTDPHATEPWTSTPAPADANDSVAPETVEGGDVDAVEVADAVEAVEVIEVIEVIDETRPEPSITSDADTDAHTDTDTDTEHALFDEVELIDPTETREIEIERVAESSALDTTSHIPRDIAGDIESDVSDDSLLTTSEFEVHQSPQAGATNSVLGFEVQYGIPMDEEPLAPATPDAFGALELVEDTPPLVPEAPAPLPPAPLPPAPVIEPSAAALPTAPAPTTPAPAAPRESSRGRGAWLVMPARHASGNTARSGGSRDGSEEDPRLKVQRVATEEERARRAPRIPGASGDARSGGKGAVIGGAIGVALAAAAAWFFMRGGM